MFQKHIPGAEVMMPSNELLMPVSDVAHIANDMLGPFPILQFFAALLVFAMVAVGGFAWIKGQKLNEPLSAPRAPEGAIQLFFDGPLKAIFDYLQEIRQRQISNRLEVKDDIAVIISNQRNTLSAEIEDSKRSLQKCMEDGFRQMHDRLDDFNNLLVRMDERDKNRK